MILLFSLLIINNENDNNIIVNVHFNFTISLFPKEWSPSLHSKHLKKKLSQQLEQSPSGIAANVLDPSRANQTQTQVEVLPSHTPPSNQYIANRCSPSVNKNLPHLFKIKISAWANFPELFFSTKMRACYD